MSKNRKSPQIDAVGEIVQDARITLDDLPVRLAFADFETDPFKRCAADPKNTDKNTLDPKPFCVGVMHADGTYWDHWGDDSAEQFVRYMESIVEPTIFYFHNGGRFDFVFIQKYMESQKPPMMIKNVLIAGKFGIHQVRDSYALVPGSLKSAVGKQEIDYIETMSRSAREGYKTEILRYLRSDCDMLRILISKFLDFVINARPVKEPEAGSKRKRAGRRIPGKKSEPFSCIKMTASGYAFEMLRSEPMSNGTYLDIATFAKGPMLKHLGDLDALFRPYYMGGRVQMFKQGVIKTDPRDGYKKYDITSSYPNAMCNFDHPVRNEFSVFGEGEFSLDADGWIDGYKGQLYFIEFLGETLGVPGKAITGMNSLNYSRGRFKMMSHEFREGLKLDYVRFETGVSAIVFPKSSSSNFAPFVQKYFAARNGMKKAIKGFKARLKPLEVELKTLGFDPKTTFIETLTSDTRHAVQACATALVNLGREIAEATALAETYKLLLNGSYGKFGFDFRNYPVRFWQNYLTGVIETGDGFTSSETQSAYDPASLDEFGRIDVGDVTTCDESYVSVMTAASITSAARAVLMRAIHDAEDVLYVDTDSMLVKSAGPDTPLETAESGSVLGWWKLEKDNVFEIAIAGPKLYALHYLDNESPDSHPITVSGETYPATWEVRMKGAKSTNKVPETGPDGEEIPCNDKLMGAGDFSDVMKIAADPDESFYALQIAPSMRVGKVNRFADRVIRRVGQAIPSGTIANFQARGVSPQLSTLEVWEDAETLKAIESAHAEMPPFRPITL